MLILRQGLNCFWTRRELDMSQWSRDDYISVIQPSCVLIRLRKRHKSLLLCIKLAARGLADHAFQHTRRVEKKLQYYLGTACNNQAVARQHLVS